MVMIIKNGDNVNDIKTKIQNLESNKKFNAYKHLNSMVLHESPLDIQKRLRDEWE